MTENDDLSYSGKCGSKNTEVKELFINTLVLGIIFFLCVLIFGVLYNYFRFGMSFMETLKS